jgi:dipeptidyl aminopeptidase/acylaminoacyl peptidase
MVSVGTFGRVQRPVPTIPIDACVGGRDFTEPRLTTDGRWLVVAVSDADSTSLVRFDLGDPADPAAPRSQSAAPETIVDTPAPRVGRGLGGGCWCFADGDHAIVYAGVDGNLWWQPVDGSGPDGRPPARRLTDHGPDRVAQAPHAAADGSRVVYVVDQSEVWQVDVASGRSLRLDDGTADFCFDPQVMPCGTGLIWSAWNVPDMPWDHARVVRVSFDGRMRHEFVPPNSVQQPRFAPDGIGVGVRDDTGWNNVWWGDRPLVDEPFEHGGPTWGLGQRSFVISPDGTHVAYTRNEAGFGRLCLVDVETALSGTADRPRELGRGVHGQLSWAAGRIAALRSGARTPTELVVYDAVTGDRRVVAVASAVAWDRDALAEPETMEVVAADGGVIHARLYRADPAHRKKGEPARMICWLHGGPTDQWQVAFMPRVAYWRAQGWDVLVPDHRGSTGHGRAYQQALRGRWGELDVTDVAAVVEHAHRTGLATPARTVLIGGSAGGFTVLGVLRHRPGLVAAAVVSYPVADLADLAERSHRFERHYTRTLVGEPPAPPAIDERARDRSPTWFADRITTPLLVLHGDDDPVVPVGQSRVLVERMRAAGAKVELVVYRGEGHGFRQRDHQVDEYQRIASFLAHHVAT